MGAHSFPPDPSMQTTGDFVIWAHCPPRIYRIDIDVSTRGVDGFVDYASNGARARTYRLPLMAAAARNVVPQGIHVLNPDRYVSAGPGQGRKCEDRTPRAQGWRSMFCLPLLKRG